MITRYECKSCDWEFESKNPNLQLCPECWKNDLQISNGDLPCKMELTKLEEELKKAEQQVEDLKLRLEQAKIDLYKKQDRLLPQVKKLYEDK